MGQGVTPLGGLKITSDLSAGLWETQQCCHSPKLILQKWPRQLEPSSLKIRTALRQVSQMGDEGGLYSTTKKVTCANVTDNCVWQNHTGGSQFMQFLRIL